MCRCVGAKVLPLQEGILSVRTCHVRFHYGDQMNTDAMNASACFTATFIKYRVPVKSTEYRTYSADLDFARSQVSYETSPSELGHASSGPSAHRGTTQ